MNKGMFFGVAAVAAVIGVGLASPMASVAGSPDKHDSNTLHKLGNAIQYPVRKLGENTSIAVHRAEGRKSVEYDRPHDQAKIVHPDGSVTPITPPRSARYAHRRHANKGHHYGQRKHHRAHHHMH
jgi:hypothetical protein